MTIKKELATVAIIGCGPRGLSALETLYARAAIANKMVKVLIFEPAVFPGAGLIYDRQQADCNWLNVSVRGLDIPSRAKITCQDFTIPAYPDYQEWIGYSEDGADSTVIDDFPLRSKLGEYLNTRYTSIAGILEKKGLLQHIPREVCNIQLEGMGVRTTDFEGKKYDVDEVVLTVGHQPIEIDDQLQGWLAHTEGKQNLRLFIEPYPVNRILASKKIDHKSVIGIRGFGLAMIDVIRALTEGRKGSFQVLDEATREMEYSPSGDEPELLVPFSLDGLPMVPKPLNKKIDLLYVPTEKELNAYADSLEKAIHASSPPKSTEFLIDAIVPLVSKKYFGLNENGSDIRVPEAMLQNIIKSWLLDESFEHDLIVSKCGSAAVTMASFIQMATGHKKASLDFCIGHVWRHCQPTMYKILSFAPLCDDLIAHIVALDERLKRYSYGPPVDSLQQLMALLKSGILTFDFVRDPQFKECEHGWEFSISEKSLVADTMINSVLDSPQVLKVTTPLIRNLLNKSLGEPLHDKLGVRTHTDGSMELENSGALPISVLGRLAKGTLIGVDAIAECFGSRSRYWAEGVFERLKSSTNFVA